MTLSSQKTAQKRSEGSAKIEMTLEIARNLFEILISNDPDSTPAPDLQTELSKLNLIDSKKPSICEISMKKQLSST